MPRAGIEAQIEGPDPKGRTMNALHDTARLYTDGSSKKIGERHIVGYGFAGRIGNRAFAVGQPLDESQRDSTLAETMAIYHALRTCYEMRPDLKRITLLTDHEGLAKWLNEDVPIPVVEEPLRAIRALIGSFDARFEAKKVKGHSLEGEDGVGNAMAHHLAMLGRIGDPVRMDMPYRRDWADRLSWMDRRLDYVPLPNWIDPRDASDILDIPFDTVVRLVANGHMVYDHYRGGIRRSSIEYIRRAILAHERGQDVDAIMEPLKPVPRFVDQVSVATEDAAVDGGVIAA